MRTIRQPQPRTVDDSILDDYECVECEQLAVAKATCSPCGHQSAYCRTHTKAKQRTMAFRFTAGLSTRCSIPGCGVLVEAVAWGRM